MTELVLENQRDQRITQVPVTDGNCPEKSKFIDSLLRRQKKAVCQKTKKPKQRGKYGR